MGPPFKAWLTHIPAREKFFVIRDGGKWKVRHNAHLFGPYFIPGEAVRSAVKMASEAGRHGGGAQVFVQASNEEFRLEWTYGLDPFPGQA